MAAHFKIITLEERIVLDAAAAAVIYVNVHAHNGGDGSSWSSAYNDLQSALTKATHASTPEQIWVADGTYSTHTTFTIPNNVSVYGGFAGYEKNINQRNIADNPTMLTDSGGNSVVTVNNANVVLDGLIISNNTVSGNGAAISENNNSTLLVSHDVFNNNTAQDGGAIDSENSAITIVNSLFHGNTGLDSSFSALGGGAIVTNNDSSIVVKGSTFLNNTTPSYGGAISTNGGALGESTS